MECVWSTHFVPGVFSRVISFNFPSNAETKHLAHFQNLKKEEDFFKRSCDESCGSLSILHLYGTLQMAQHVFFTNSPILCLRLHTHTHSIV